MSAALLRAAPFVTLLVFLAPVLAGLAATLLPAFGFLPALGRSGFGFDAWRDLLAWPGLPRSLAVTLFTGFASTLLSLWMAFEIAARAPGSRLVRAVQRAIPAALATPHAALAIGFAIVIAPSGWLARMVSPWATGWDTPPDVALVHDPFGLALTAGLVLKEMPYLLLMLFAALNQVRAAETLAVARSLGYGARSAWYRTVLPQVWPQLRLPVYAVLAFSLSVVDVALILGPTNPPTLAVQTLRWLAAPDLRDWFPGAAAALLQAALAVVAILLWRGGERAVASVAGWVLMQGRRPRHRADVGVFAALAAGLFAALSLAALILWSVAGPWRFPEAWPASLTAAVWQRHFAAMLGPAAVTAALAALTAATAVFLAVACLENERRHGARPGQRALWLVYAPLLVPQLAFLFGLQLVLLRLGIDGTWLAMALAHLVFVLPYVFLALADPWRSLDPRYARTAAALGAAPLRSFVLVIVPLMARPLLTAFATGFAVSAGLYLPTLFAGGGRFATLTTEAVTLAAGGDRRILGAFAILQAGLPLLAFTAALLVPAWLFRHRRAMRSA
jgi:putative thiamine transport system permease protein